jgi:glutamate synthase domain-containing protein 1
MDEDERIIKYLERYSQCWDRFTFDSVFRYLLRHDYDHEGAMDMMIAFCSFSGITWQERIHNKYYRKINLSERMSPDLKVLMGEELIRRLN